MAALLIVCAAMFAMGLACGASTHRRHGVRDREIQVIGCLILVDLAFDLTNSGSTIALVLTALLGGYVVGSGAANPRIPTIPVATEARRG